MDAYKRWFTQNSKQCLASKILRIKAKSTESGGLNMYENGKSREHPQLCYDELTGEMDMQNSQRGRYERSMSNKASARKDTDNESS